MNPINFLPAKKENESDFIALMKDFYNIDNYPINENKTRENYRYILNQPNRAKIFMIKSGDDFVGYIIINYLFSFEFGGTISFLDELYIDDKMRGKGIGKQAVAFVQHLAEKEGLKRMFLEVEPHNKPAQSLYEKLGWKHHHRSLMCYKP